MWRGSEAGADVWQLTLLQLREAMISTGLLTPADKTRPSRPVSVRLVFLSPVTTAALGRRPWGPRAKTCAAPPDALAMCS
jgi:hypothetical protein